MDGTVSVTYKIPLELKEKLQEASEKSGLSMNAIIIFAVSEYLEYR